MPSIVLNVFRALIAIAYTMGGAVHAANLAGFGPPPPPEKRSVFRVLDVVYLALDIVVVVGMVTGAWWGFVAFFVAAGSQLVLYLGFADYFASDDEQHHQLSGLVHFHVLTAAVMGTLLALTSDTALF